MATWGPQRSNRNKTQQTSARARQQGGRSGGRQGGVRDQTPPGGGRPEPAPATGEVREHLSSRRDDYIGLGLILFGALLALAIYFGTAGLLGEGLERLTGWIFGLGRFAVPAGFVAVGVAFIRDPRSASPKRLAIGWVMVALAVLGLLQVFRSPDGFSDLDGLYDAGGFVGGALGAPLEALIAPAGAALVLIALLVGGAMLITTTSLKTMAQNTGGFIASVIQPLGRYAKKAVNDLSTLSDRGDGSLPPPSVPNVAGQPTALFDGAEHDIEVYTDPAEAGPKRRKPKVSTGSASTGKRIDGATVGEWVLPSGKYLKQPGETKIDLKAVEARGVTLQESLAQHNVETELIGMTVGPTVTRYELELGPGVKVAKVTNLQKDIAYAMAATDVRILAPIPGRSAIGVEVPNHQRQLVALGDLLASEEAERATHPLEVAVGKDIAGKAVFLDIAATPHMLIAGATGSGKSSGINCIITSLLMRTTPDQVRLILVDPKQVEMGQYQRLPHLLTEPVTNPKKAANALGWAVKEMERRYDVLSEVGFRDITGYNKAVAAGEIEPPPGIAPEDSPYEHMPYIVIVVDELNDLMMVAARDVEESITRIAQKARAVGIHLIVATQRPSVNVITGVIKANVPARMAFAVSSLTDSRVILDQPGAEKLVGQGDMLLLPGNTSVPNRIQGSFVGEDEVRKVVRHWREQAPEPVYSDNVEADDEASPASATHPSEQLSLDGESLGFAVSDAAPGALDVTSDAHAFSAGEEDEDTAMRRQAMELIVRSQLGSTSMLQRKLKVGFARAGRIMDELEEMGVVGPSEGSKAREVLMTVEEFELLQQNGSL